MGTFAAVGFVPLLKCGYVCCRPFCAVLVAGSYTDGALAANRFVEFSEIGLGLCRSVCVCACCCHFSVLKVRVVYIGQIVNRLRRFYRIVC